MLSTCSLNKVGRLDHVGAGWKSVSVRFVMMDSSGVESTTEVEARARRRRTPRGGYSKHRGQGLFWGPIGCFLGGMMGVSRWAALTLGLIPSLNDKPSPEEAKHPVPPLHLNPAGSSSHITPYLGLWTAALVQLPSSLLLSTLHLSHPIFNH
jgi:hypothetical protein